MKRYSVILAFLLVCTDSVAFAQSKISGGWKQSLKAGIIDGATGKPIRGTEILHLVGHKGRLYAGNGYWMDTRGYANIPWAQVLVLETADASGKADLALGPKHLRVTALRSVTVTTDGDGKLLVPTVNLLLAASDSEQQSHIWIRDDDRAQAARSPLRPDAQQDTSGVYFANVIFHSSVFVVDGMMRTLATLP